MKHTLFFLLLIFSTGLCYSQQPVELPAIGTAETPLYTIVEKMPEPKGGTVAFYQFIADSTIYPADALSKGIQGKVFVRFVVTAGGKIESVEVLKGLDPALDQEAVRLIKLSEKQPGWIPGQEQGRNVDVQLVQQVLFRTMAADENSNQEGNGSRGNGENRSLVVVYNKAEVMPMPQQGWEQYHQLFRNNFTYPKEALSSKIRGSVYLQLVIDKKGNMRQLTVKSGVHATLDKEALRLIKIISDSIAWSPGMLDGRPVDVRMVLPVHFFHSNAREPFVQETEFIYVEEADKIIAYEKLPVATEVNGTEIYNKPDKLPEPKGGIGDLSAFFKKHLVYPEEAIEDKAMGEVLIRFIVSKKGGAYEEKLVKSIHPALDAEALRLIKLFNQHNAWIPATYKLKNVSSYVEVPVKFIYYPNHTSTADSAHSNLNVYENPDEEATPKGGMQAFYQFIYQNLEYPQAAIASNKDGTAYVRFIIDENGDVQNPHIVAGRELGYGLDQQAVRVVGMTKWNPASHGGRYVKQQKVLPIKFKLQR